MSQWTILKHMYMLLHLSKSILHFKCSLEFVCTLISSGEPWRTKCNICTLKAMSVQEKSNSPIQTSSRLTASSSFTCYSCDLNVQISTQISQPYARVLDTLRLFLTQVVPIRKSQASFFPSSLEFIFLLHFSFTYILSIPELATWTEKAVVYCYFRDITREHHTRSSTA